MYVHHKIMFQSLVCFFSACRRWSYRVFLIVWRRRSYSFADSTSPTMMASWESTAASPSPRHMILSSPSSHENYLLTKVGLFSWNKVLFHDFYLMYIFYVSFSRDDVCFAIYRCFFIVTVVSVIRDCPINRTCRLIAHSTSDFDDRLQFYKIDYFDYFEKINCI